jgi:hypothetical protein
VIVVGALLLAGEFKRGKNHWPPGLPEHGSPTATREIQLTFMRLDA